jgi:hypothetical protein
MQKTLLKITTSFQNTWLVHVKHDSFSDENDILYGDTLRLSITPQDTYYFSAEIGLTYKKEILSTEIASNHEVAFFTYMAEIQEKAYSKSLARKYHIEDYIIEPN